MATVYHAVSLYDEVIAARLRRARGRRQRRRPASPVEDVPQDPTNLAAAAALAAGRPRRPRARTCALHITKGIPVAGGMAGGSADAAAALVACDALWGTGAVPSRAARRWPRRLGSDVPFSLLGGTAIGTGRGEVLAPVLARGRFHWVVALADGGLSTPDVYAECDRLRAAARSCPSRGSLRA